MSIAQKLYEGIELENETTGLITYMRTDSIRLSDEFIKSTYGFIKGHFGEDYVGYVKKTTKKIMFKMLMKLLDLQILIELLIVLKCI